MTKGRKPAARHRITPGLLVPVILVLSLLVPIAPARAANDAASLHFNRGQVAMSQGDPVAAAHEFLAAWRAEPTARSLLAAAIAFEKAGDRDAAVAYYWWYLNSGAASAKEQEWLFPRILALSTSEKPPAPTEPKPSKPKPSKPEPEPEPKPEKPRALLAPTPPPPAPPARTERRWYGLPILIGDGIGLGVLLGGVANDNSGAIILGGLAMALTSPIVHSHYDHGGRAWGGFFLRLGGVAVGALAGDETGALVGYLGAFALDTFAIARDEVPIVPTVDVDEDHAMVGVTGRF
jgi:hypothetical protein